MKTKETKALDLTNSTPRNCLIDPSRKTRFNKKLFLHTFLAIVLIGGSLALFLCAAGGVSYGDSARSMPLKVTANAQFYPPFGTPNDALVTDDDAYVLVSVTGKPHPAQGSPLRHRLLLPRVFRFSAHLVSALTRSAANKLLISHRRPV